MNQKQSLTRHLLYGVRVICARQALDNPWVDHKWEIHDLVPLSWEAGSGDLPAGSVPFVPLRTDASDDTDEMQLFVADIQIDLHHAEAEAYAENLQSSDPALYIVLRPVEELESDHDRSEGQADVMLLEVSLSPYSAQDYEDCGEDQIIKLPLIGPMADLVSEFVAAFFKPEPFIKRKRDRVKMDDPRGADPRLKKRFH